MMVAQGHHPGRSSGVFDRDQSIAALTVAELLAAGYAYNDPHVVALRAELR